MVLIPSRVGWIRTVILQALGFGVTGAEAAKTD